MDNLVEEIKRNLPRIDQMVSMPDGQSKGKGKDIQGSHPVHGSDTEKNLIIHTDTDTWHCFRHGIHSDRLGWIAVDNDLVSCDEANDISHVFPQVLEIAADLAGVDMDKYDYDEEEMEEKREERETLQRGFRCAAEYFKKSLENNEKVIEWIKDKYGFDEEMIEEYEIGYAPPTDDKKGLRKRLENEIGADAFSTGLIQKWGDNYVDFFRGRVVFTYKSHDDYIYFIARETPWTPDDNFKDNKYLKQLTGDNHAHVSDEVRNSIWGLNEIRGSREMIVTEGITDAVSASVWDYPVISPVTVKFKDDDIQRVRSLAKNREVYICNDADEGGKQGALDMIEEISNSYMIELPEGYDLNEYFIDHSKSDFEDLKGEALGRDEALAKYKKDVPYLFYPVVRNNAVDRSRVRKRWDRENQMHQFSDLDTILEGIDNIEEALSVFRRTEKTYHRTPTAVESEMRTRIIAGVIRRHMEKYGKFLYDRETDIVHYFSEEEHEVVKINTQDGESYLNDRYGVNTSNQRGKFVLKSLKDYAVKHGEEVDVKKYFHYDKDEELLYIHDRDHHYYILDGESIEKRSNGEDVYFETKHEEGIEYLEEGEREYPEEVAGQIEEWEGEGSFLHRVMINRINFTSKTALTERQQRLQMLITLYMFPFGTTFRAKPITAFIGEKGSGKSVVMKILGRFLTNPDFDVSNMPDEDDFYVAAHNRPMYFLDNVDKECEWMNDALAAIATGAKMQQRELYTNYEITEAKLDTFLGLTSRTPHFNRDDVVDRLLIFYISRIENNIKLDHLIEPINEYRDTLWSEYIDDLNEIVKKMREMDTKGITSKHRLVDWVVFAKVTKEALDLDEKRVDKVIDDMRYEKMAFSLQDDRILPALRNLRDSPTHNTGGMWLPATKLHKWLCEADDLYEEDYQSSQSLARRLPNVRTELEELVGLKVKRNRNKHRNEYMLSDDGSGLNDFLDDEFEDGSHDSDGGGSELDITDVDTSDEDEGVGEGDGEGKTLFAKVRDTILELKEEGDTPHASTDKVIEKVVESGVDREEVEKQIERMRTNGKIFYPPGTGGEMLELV